MSCLLIKRAKELRKNQTIAEQKLWYHLRGHRFSEIKFKRQKPLGPYIVDFVSFGQKIIIELDGSQHFEQQAYDEQRDKWLKAQGYKVLRIWNNDMLNNPEQVLNYIWQEAF